MKQGEGPDITLSIGLKSGDITTKVKLYPKELLKITWRRDKKLHIHDDAAVPPKCLQCGSPLAVYLTVNALSRYVDMQTCETCGMGKTLRGATHTPLPLTE